MINTTPISKFLNLILHNLRRNITGWYLKISSKKCSNEITMIPIALVVLLMIREDKIRFSTEKD